MKDDNSRLTLTAEEEAALERDEAIVSAVRQCNTGSDMSFAKLFPDAKPLSAMLYWSLVDRPDARARLKQAIANGSDVNETGDNNYTALHGAAEKNIVENVALLIANGADAKATTIDGKTPIDLAAAAGHADVVAILKAHLQNQP